MNPAAALALALAPIGHQRLLANLISVGALSQMSDAMHALDLQREALDSQDLGVFWDHGDMTMMATSTRISTEHDLD
jgi:hypothetical protein